MDNAPQKKRILLVDDEPDVLDVLEQRLKANDYEVHSAQNGQAALSLIQQWVPDLILLDILMPVMDGFTTYKELKKNSQTAGIPVIVLTARSKMEDTFTSVGVDAFLVKPFDAKTLITKIEQVLERSKGTVTETPENELPLNDPPAPRKNSNLLIYVVGGSFVLVFLLAIFSIFYMAVNSNTRSLPINMEETP